MAKTSRRPALDKGGRSEKADRKVAKAAKGPKAKPARGKPAKPAKKGRGADGVTRAKAPRAGGKRALAEKQKGPGGAELRRKALRPKAPADEAAEAPRAVHDERPDPARPRALAVAQAALDKKADDVLVLDVRGLTSYADYFVVATADSERQAAAIADHVDEQLKKQGSSRVGSEGYESGRWILIDYGDVVAHVMSREARGFYDLEGLWADAPRVGVA